MELQPTQTLVPTAKAYLPSVVLANALGEVEIRFDDLRTAQYLVKEQLEKDVEFDEDMKKFRHELGKVSETFIAAISALNLSGEESQFDGCLMAYENALDGYDEEGKFVHFWRKLLIKNEVRL